MAKTHRSGNPLLFSQLFSTREAATALGVSRQTIARRVKRGYMTPTHRVPNGPMIFEAAEIERVRKGIKRRRRSKAA